MQEEIDEIEDAEPFDIGFPLSMLFGYGGKHYRSRMTSSDMLLVNTTTRLESVPKPQVSRSSDSQRPVIAELTGYHSRLHRGSIRSSTSNSKLRGARVGFSMQKHSGEAGKPLA